MNSFELGFCHFPARVMTGREKRLDLSIAHKRLSGQEGRWEGKSEQTGTSTGV